MEIPIYNNKNNTRAMMSGDYSGTEFTAFLEKILDTGQCSDNSTQEGILKRAIDKGTDGLSSKQISVLRKIVEPFDMKCGRCGLDIPLSEIDVYEGGDLCGYYLHNAEKSAKD